jgi:hypothetical protein
VQATDTSAIQRVIGRARRRIRGQWALEGATTAAILAAAAALTVVFLIRVEVVGRTTGVALLIGTIGIVIAGAVLKAARRLDDELVARRIDRASNLADRLSTAIAFTRAPSPQAQAHAEAADAAAGDETHELMVAAIRDGVRAVPRADVRRATPFVAPADLRAALGFIAISALAAGLTIPTVDRTPHLYRVDPDHGASGDDVVVRGANLMTGIARPLAALPTRTSIGAPNVPPGATAPATFRGFVPSDAAVTLGAGKAHPAIVLDWSADQIVVRIPDGAPIGPTTLTAWIGDDPVGPLAFTVVDRKDPLYHKEGAVVLDPDDRAYLDTLVAALRAVAERDRVPELDEFAKHIEQLLRDAELGKITKEQLLDSLSKAEDKLTRNAEPDQAELNKQLADMGKELSKEQTTKDLGDALQKNDLDKAQQELEKLADKLDKQEMSEKQEEQLAKQLERVAKQMEQREQQRTQKAQMQQQKLEDEIRRLEKKKEQAKNEPDRLDAERQLNKKKDELKQLEKDQEAKEQSAQRQALKRLNKDMEKAAENLQRKQKKTEKEYKNGTEKQDPTKEGERPSQNLKDAARETGRIDQDQRKQATQKKMSSQMDDLREAMRRAKQKGNKGPNDPFGKQNKNQDFAQRARGQRGQGQAWKPSQGQGKGGQGQGKPGQQGQAGQQPGGKEWGVGHDDNLVGDPTAMSGNTKDDSLQGAQGKDGGGTRETILAAAQKGFASKRYRDVYGKYQQIVEEVMRTEKLPSSYKYYVKRYFAKIHPSTPGTPEGAASSEAPAPAAPATTEDKTP